MARTYKVSADVSEKEKIIGGILTLAQGAWIAAGLIISATFFIIFAKIMPPILALILALPTGTPWGVLFALYKKEGLTLFTYLRYQHAFKRKNKKLINTLTYKKDFNEQQFTM